MENIEMRYASNISVDPENKTIAGTAIIFDSESEPLTTENNVRFIERIRKGSVTDEFLRTQDILFLYNHNSDSPYGVLARSKKGVGTLSFNVDDVGVHFRFKLKKRSEGLIEDIQSNDVTGCSFAFKVGDEPSAQTITKRSDGMIMRDVNNITMVRDFSIVDTPAYSATSISVRSVDQAAELLNKPVETVPAPVVNEAEEKEKLFQEYYKRIRRKYLL